MRQNRLRSSIYSNNEDSSKKSKGLIVNGFQICTLYITFYVCTHPVLKYLIVITS